jgi:DNA ligase-1
MTRLSGLVETSERVAAVSGRNAKIAEIARLLRSLSSDEIALAVAWLAGETRQSRHGIGYATLQAATPAAPAASSTLELRDLDDALGAIARIAGRGAAGERKRQLAALLAAATGPEQSFIVRLLTGELRQGALEGLMIEAVASASTLPVAEVRRAAMVAGGIASVAAKAMTGEPEALEEFSIALMRPLAPMLAQPADDIEDALSRVSPASLEWKLDGARVQVHKDGAEVRIFTRTGNDVTVAAPEIVEAVKGFNARSLILDGEAIALLPNGSPYPFQDTMRRFGRALRIDEMRERMPLSVFFFDCLRRDDADLVAGKGSDRFAALADVVPARFLIPRLVAGDVAAAQAFYDDAVQRKHEGVMVKHLDAAYEPGARSASWLKVKRVHTLDLVVLAAEWGHGRRHGRLSNLHLGARDEKTGAFVMLGKTFKGLTDAILDWQTQELLARETHRDAWTVYVRPELVVEITFNDLQASPRYPGGLALRFARLKGYRPDKHAADADTMDTVRAIYAGQTN